MAHHICSITELNSYVKNLVDSDANLSAVYVRGEISNYKFHSSGHHYMSLKDDSSSVRAVMFKYDAMKLKFRPENGMKIIALGRVSVYPRDGQYQLYINNMIPDGIGALYAAFEQLKRKLEGEGLFDASKKKLIPRYPSRIAVITSPTGAAIRDILRILKARYPLCDAVVCPVLVQGKDAPADIASMIKYVNLHKIADLIITGRGGGSLEDLYAFNDEAVARAISDSEIPVISAVGHEPDVTIADFVADLRAATPSNAAELAVPDVAELLRRLKDSDSRISGLFLSRIAFSRERVKKLSEKRVMASPRAYFSERRMALDGLSERMGNSEKLKIAFAREKFSRAAAALDAMSPLKVIARGYSIATNENGDVLKTIKNVKKDDEIDVRMCDGIVKCTVNTVEGV